MNQKETLDRLQWLYEMLDDDESDVEDDFADDEDYDFGYDVYGDD